MTDATNPSPTDDRDLNASLPTPPYKALEERRHDQDVKALRERVQARIAAKTKDRHAR